MKIKTIKNKKEVYKEAFASGKSRWTSTLKSSAQSKGALGRTSQNKK